MNAASTPAQRPRSAPFQTFGELLAADPHRRSTVGVCRFCRAFYVPGVYYAMRSGCCFECAKTRKDEVLPKVASSERKALQIAARRVADGKGREDVVWWVRHFARVNAAFADWAYEQAKAAKGAE